MTICKECHQEIDELIKERVIKYKIPFKCKACGGIYFPHEALRSTVIFWPDPIERYNNSPIIIPDYVKFAFQSEKGTILSIGKGYFTPKGKFIPTILKPGDRVIYDKEIPESWSYNFENKEGIKYPARYATEFDMKAKALENGEIELIGERLLVKLDPLNSKIGSIFIPPKYQKKVDKGLVIQLGGIKRPDLIKVGDKILFDINLVIGITLKGQDYVIVREKDVKVIYGDRYG
jgi:co-chaperonin GroES (HSP10)